MEINKEYFIKSIHLERVVDRVVIKDWNLPVNHVTTDLKAYKEKQKAKYKADNVTLIYETKIRFHVTGAQLRFKSPEMIREWSIRLNDVVDNLEDYRTALLMKNNATEIIQLNYKEL